MNEKIKQLHAFENDVVDVIIAYDQADAIKVWEETIGEKYDVEENGGEFEQAPDEKQMTLYEDNTIDPDPIPERAELVKQDKFSHTYRATYRAWADTRGRCFLGSDEY